tara:strand:+ start:6780 stop:8570 length:1791 start_codon:yes stop_codon:yes gene_type:complete
MKASLKVITVVFVLSLPFITQWSALEIIKLKTFDAFVPEKQQSNYFTILNITEEDIEREGGWPLPRARLAEIQTELMARGAFGVGWTVAFPQPDRMGGDKKFAESLQDRNSILAMYENAGSGYPATVGTVIMGEPVGGYPASGVVQNIEILRNAASQGIASAPVDVDQLVRRMPLLMKTPDGWVSAFGTEVLKALVGSDTYIIKTNQNGIQEIVVQGLPPVPTDSLGRKWISWVKTDQTNLSEMDVKERFVFIGTDAMGIMPQLATPVGLLEPHKIQAALAESILIQDSPRIPDWSYAAELGIFAFSVAFVWLLVTQLGVTWGVTSFLAIFGLTAYSGIYLIQSGVLIDVTWSLISQFFAASGAFYLNFRTQYRLRQQIKKQFEHYLDPRQVKQLQKDPHLLKLGGETRYCTFLFTDLRGFTSLSEKLSPQEVTEVMNATLTVQVEEIQRAGGCIDKFIGDACMAIFSAPLDLAEQENRAVAAAIRIQKRVKELNEKLPVPVAIGVGVNSGDAVVGNMGSNTRFDYTAIGDAVNVAARLESATKEAGVDILIGYNTAQKCKYLLKSLEPIKVKGKSEALKVYTWDSKLQQSLPDYS